MVVMITPVAFDTIGYQTYIIFAAINAFIVPCVYFFYPGEHPSTLDRFCHFTYNGLHRNPSSFT